MRREPKSHRLRTCGRIRPHGLGAPRRRTRDEAGAEELINSDPARGHEIGAADLAERRAGDRGDEDEAPGGA